MLFLEEIHLDFTIFSTSYKKYVAMTGISTKVACLWNHEIKKCKAKAAYNFNYTKMIIIDFNKPFVNINCF